MTRANYLAGAVAAFACAASLAGCGGAATSTPPASAPTATPNTKATATPTAKPTATPTAVPTATPVPQRLYAAGPGAADVFYYTSPFAAASTPTGSFSSSATEPVGLVVDPSGGVIEVDETTESLLSYSRPNPTSSLQFTAATTFEPAGMAYDASGKFYVADYTGTVQTASALSASTTFTPLITTGLDGPEDVCFDTAGNLYVVNNGNGAIDVYAPPSFTATPTVLATGATNITRCAYDAAANQIAITQGGSGASGSVLIYNLPLTASSTPAETFTYTAIYPDDVEFDRAGNLYLTVTGPENVIQVYAPPFTTGTNPTATFQFSSPVFSGTAQPIQLLAFGT